MDTFKIKLYISGGVFFADFPFLRQSCSSLHSFFIEEKSNKNLSPEI